MSGSSVTNKLVRPRTKCSSESEESCAEQELNCLEEGEDAMTDEEGEGVDGEGEAGAVDWRVRAGPRNKPTAREREEHEATHMPLRGWCTHCMMGRGRTHHHVSKQKSEKLLRNHGLLFSLTKNSTASSQTIPEGSVTCIAVKEDRHQNIMSSVFLKNGIEEPCNRSLAFHPRGFAAPVQYGAPANMRRPASGLAPVTEQPHQPRQGDLTMEEREDLTVLLIAIRDELLDRDEDPALIDLVYQLMDWLLDADTSEIADDARATIPRLHHLWCGTARRFDLTIDDSDEDVSNEEDIGEDYGIAALVHGTPHSVHAGVQVREPAQDRTTPKRSLSWWCHSLGHVKHTRGAGRD